MKTKLFFAVITFFVLFRVEFSFAQTNDSIPREDGTKVAMLSIGRVTIVTNKSGSIKKCILREINPDNIVYESEGCLHGLVIDKIVRIDMNTSEAVFFDENNKPVIKSKTAQINSDLKQGEKDAKKNQTADDPFNKYNHLIGIGAGLTTGSGLSYRLYYRNFGTQLNISPSTVFKNNRYNIGLTLLGRISPTKKTNIYLYFSNSLSHKQVCEYSSVYDSTTCQYNYNNYHLVTKDQWNSGLGVDFEFNARRRVKFNLMFGLAAYDSFNSVGPTGEFGIHYKI